MIFINRVRVYTHTHTHTYIYLYIGDKIENKWTQLLLLLLHNTLKIPLANVVRLLAERSDTKSNVKLDGFRSWLRASYVFSHTEEFCGWQYIYNQNHLSSNHSVMHPFNQMGIAYLWYQYLAKGKFTQCFWSLELPLMV